MDKKAFRQIKVVGLMAIIPLVLIGGPWAAYVAGDYLRRRFAWPPLFFLLIISLGFFSSVFEIIRIVKKAIAIDKEE
jgi:hypothetical protein